MKKISPILLLSGATLATFHAHSATLNHDTVVSQLRIANNLKFNPANYTKKSFTYRGHSYEYRAFENISYIKYPIEPDYQKINIYIPEAYFNHESIQGFSDKNAPIFMPNSVGGYMPAKPATVEGGMLMPPMPNIQEDKENAIMMALANGYIVAAPGARGRTLQKDGKYTGKAPAAIIDLKAAVRYLKANDAIMPGDANKIISNGTSAGGALSLLLGSSANQPIYEPYLKAIGAANASDSIWAVSAYCPIANLEHADSAYEWQFNGVNAYQKMDISMLDYKVQRKLVNGTLSPAQITLSNALKPLFPDYVNSLNLKDSQGEKLQLNANGDGSFKDLIVSYLMQSAQNQLNQGKDLSKLTYLTINNGKVTALDFDLYNKTIGRQKAPPAFDGVDLSTGENQLFGTSVIDKQHFTTFSKNHTTVTGSGIAKQNVIKMMNPMSFLSPKYSNNLPTNWRIRVGTNDRDTSLAISAIIATKLQNQGKSVDYFLPWGQGHSGDYDLDELLKWMQGLK